MATGNIFLNNYVDSVGKPTKSATTTPSPVENNTDLKATMRDSKDNAKHLISAQAVNVMAMTIEDNQNAETKEAQAEINKIDQSSMITSPTNITTMMKENQNMELDEDMTAVGNFKVVMMDDEVANGIISPAVLTPPVNTHLSGKTFLLVANIPLLAANIHLLAANIPLLAARIPLSDNLLLPASTTNGLGGRHTASGQSDTPGKSSAQIESTASANPANNVSEDAAAATPRDTGRDKAAASYDASWCDAPHPSTPSWLRCVKNADDAKAPHLTGPGGDNAHYWDDAADVASPSVGPQGAQRRKVGKPRAVVLREHRDNKAAVGAVEKGKKGEDEDEGEVEDNEN
ncbi:hypothetical protein B0H67DRAFT_565762 [Lasiosphaeris hirsuta]|uniref:Uncharacterized protein n=1 Tax=Lasiosphaeris hirsuta TaxID=260670 RepID=A0AA40BCJ2_9PEZI|nr:hypothetical protein B0H67DRAFT_565762 [Lasiosphaeris hirsuta]